MKITTVRVKLFALIIASLMLAQCTFTGYESRTPEEKRSAILQMQDEVLTELYSLKPDVRAQINAAPGYAVFNNANINLIFASFGGGVGLVHDNVHGIDTYMRMGEIGLGIGAGVKEFRVVFVFHDHDALERFVELGWSFGGQADAAAKAGDLGVAVGGEAVFDNVTLYQLTQSGLSLQATVKGTRHWEYTELN